jgi:predicted lipoprotein with Yx(FWY)xxD motif
MNWKLTFAALGLCGLATAATAQDYGATVYESGDTLQLRHMSSAAYGRYVAGEDGRALYILAEDRQGPSRCNASCTAVWAPVLLDDGEALSGVGLEASLVGRIERADGSMQVTYGGWPLYTYVRDDQAGDINGHRVDDRWGEWYLMSPNGRPKDLGRPLYERSGYTTDDDDEY